MGRRRRQSNDDVWAGFLAAIVLAAMVITVVLIIGAFLELFRIYATRTGSNPEASRRLWGALGALGLSLLGAGALYQVAPELGISLAAISTLVYVIFVCVLEEQLRRAELRALADFSDLDTYLEWPAATAHPVPAMNGRAKAAEPTL